MTIADQKNLIGRRRMRHTCPDEVNQITQCNQAPEVGYRGERQRPATPNQIHQGQKICAHSRTINQGRANNHHLQARRFGNAVQTLLGLPFTDSVGVRRSWRIKLREHLPRRSEFTMNFGGTDKDQTPHARNGSLTRQIQRCLNVHAAKLRGRVHRMVVHHMDPGSQMNNHINPNQHRLPGGLTVNFTDADGFSGVWHSGTRSNSCANKHALPDKLLTCVATNQPVGTRDHHFHIQAPPRSLRYTGERKKRRILRTCQNMYLICR